MIERKFVAQNMKEHEVKTYLAKELSRVGLSDVKLQRTPLGEKILIIASRPGLVVGKGGGNITKLTNQLKNKFGLENPQIEIEEVLDSRADAAITAEMIANSLERYGSSRFKGVGHKALSTVMAAGALGVEILISGKIPSSRAKTWRFYMGYLKKCGDISIVGVHKAQQIARLKSGVVGIQVTIMPGSTELPDKIQLLDEPTTIIEEVKTGDGKIADSIKKAEKEKKENKEAKKKSAKKKVAKKKLAKKTQEDKAEKSATAVDSKDNDKKTDNKETKKAEE